LDEHDYRKINKKHDIELEGMINILSINFKAKVETRVGRSIKNPYTYRTVIRVKFRMDGSRWLISKTIDLSDKLMLIGKKNKLSVSKIIF
jgi:hypothetical protein